MHESDSQRSGCLSGSAFVSKLVNMLDHEVLREGAKTFSGSHYDIDVQAWPACVPAGPPTPCVADMTEDALAQEMCTPCCGGASPLNPDEVQSLLPQATGWSALEGNSKIAGHFKFKDIRQTFDFVIADGELAKSEFHHPVSINFGWGVSAKLLQTKIIKNLHENDLIMAANIYEIAAGMNVGE